MFTREPRKKNATRRQHAHAMFARQKWGKLKGAQIKKRTIEKSCRIEARLRESLKIKGFQDIRKKIPLLFAASLRETLRFIY
jgi:hypothetical protein